MLSLRGGNAGSHQHCSSIELGPRGEAGGAGVVGGCVTSVTVYNYVSSYFIFLMAIAN